MEHFADDAAACCCFTGHRPEHLPWGQEESRQDCTDFYLRLAQATDEMILRGCRIFYTGMARGVDMMAAQIALGLREARPERGLKVIAILPHPQQAARWSARDRRLYQLILALCDGVLAVRDAYTPSCFHERNRYMVDHAAYVIAGFDGVSRGGTACTVDYARRKGRTIIMVSPYKNRAVPP